MPRLPDVNDLGNRPIPVSRRGIARGSVSPVGGALSDLGDTAYRVATDYLKKEDRESYALGMQGLAVEDVTTRAELEKDADYETYGERWQKRMGEAAAKAAANIRSSQDRALFEQEASLYIQRGAVAVGEMAQKKAADIGRAGLNEFLTESRNAGLATKDHAVRQTIIQSANDAVYGARDKGYISAEEAGATIRKWSSSFAEGSLALLPAAERIQKLTNPQGNVAELLPADQRAALVKSAEDEVRQLDAAAKRELAEKRAVFASDFEIALARGEKTYADIERAYTDGDITPDARTRYTLALDKYLKTARDESDMIVRVTHAAEGGVPLDPKLDKDRKALDAHYKRTAAAWTELEEEEVIDRTVNYTLSFGMAPTPLKSLIRGSLRNGKVDQAILAADLVEKLRTGNPQILNDFSDEDIRLATLISTYTDYGMAPAKAVERAQEALTISEPLREARKADYAARAKSSPSKKWLEGELNSIWTDDPSLDPVMMAEFDDLARTEFEKTGNLDASRKFALTMVNRVWGRTEIGPQRYMKLPPEKYYGLPTMSPADNSKWMKEQLVADINSAAQMSAEPITADRLVLLPDPVRTGKDGLPIYQVVLKGADGVFYAMSAQDGQPMRWHPDWTTSPARARLNAETATELEDARQARAKRFNK